MGIPTDNQVVRSVNDVGLVTGICNWGVDVLWDRDFNLWDLMLSPGGECQN